MPLQYGPYYGYPGFGYGVVMPASPYGFPSNPYMETPGYVVPHTQLHLTDYRRLLNPHFTPAMAYHTRRFRYQHVTAPRETTSSEVQTDPLPQGTSDSWLSGASENGVRSAQSTRSDSGQGSSSTNTSTSLCLEASPQAGGAEGLRDPDVEVMPTPPQATATPKGACMFQREEVRIECDGALSGLKIVSSHETTAESTQDAPGDLAQCDVWSVSSAEGIIPLYHPPLTEGTAITQDGMCLTEQLEQQPCMPSYPDILLVGGSPSSGTEKPELPCTEGCNVPARKTASDPVTDIVQVCREAGNNNASSLKEACFKILRLPFEMRYFEGLQKVESSVWSMEPLVPYMPLVDQKVQHDLEDKKVIEKNVPAKMAEACEVPMETSVSQVPVTSSEAHCENSTSVPPYLPSGSWLADFGNVYYYSKLPPSVQEHLSSFSASAEQLGDKLSNDSEGQAMVTFAGRMAGKHTHLLSLDGKGHLYPKDHLTRLPAIKSIIPSDDGQRSCSRCAKRSIPCGSTLKVSGVKRHRTALPASTDMTLSRVTCRCCSGKVLRKGSGPNVLDSQDGAKEMENDAAQNGAHPAMPKQLCCEANRPTEGGGPKCSKRHLEKCSVKLAKLREQNCACKDLGDSGIYGGSSPKRTSMVGVCNENVVVWNGAGDERKTQEQRSNSQRSQREKSRQGTVPVPGKGGSENGNRLKNHSKQRKQCALSQERLHLKTSSKVIAQQLQKNDTEALVEGFFNQSSWTKHGTNRRDTRY
ncbi:uncharacterized protein LOC108927696 [Scleropages formosus]|nr:uncharacterized protein LOC108927696 [Scleropages formosus]